MATRRVVVVGGGVAGLSAAYRIRETARARGLEIDVRVIEAGNGLGGKIASIREEGFLCETGPNGFLDNEPATLRLVDDLGLRDSLQRSNDAARRRYLVRKGRPVEMHMHPVKFLKSPLLSLRAKLRMGMEYWVSPKQGTREETVGEFGRRRLGSEFTETMLDAMVSGIYAGDVDRLSVAAAFPKIVALEAEHGGLFRGMLAKRKEVRARKAEARAKAKAEAAAASEDAEEVPSDASLETGAAQAMSSTNGDGPVGEVPAADDPATEPEAPRKVEPGPGGVLHSFREGMGEPILALGHALGSRAIQCGTAVARLSEYGGRGGFRVHFADGDSMDADAVVVTTPARASSQILAGFADEASEALGEIEIAGVHVVCLGLRRDQVRDPLEGFGVLIPRREGIRTLGSIFSSSTFEGRAPKGFSLVTNMIGGRHDPEANDLTDDELLAQVLGDLRPLLGIEGEPVYTRVVRWARGIPQYELGHLERIERAREDAARHPGLFLGGNSIAGVSFNQCIAHAETLGQEVCDFLQGKGSDAPASREEATS